MQIFDANVYSSKVNFSQKQWLTRYFKKFVSKLHLHAPRRTAGKAWSCLEEPTKFKRLKNKTKNIFGKDLVDGKANVVQGPLLLVAHHVRLVLLGH